MKKIDNLLEQATKNGNTLYFLRDPKGNVFIYQMPIKVSKNDREKVTEEETIKSIYKARRYMFDICLQRRHEPGGENFGVLEILPKNLDLLLKKYVEKLKYMEEVGGKCKLSNIAGAYPGSDAGKKDENLSIVFLPDKRVYGECKGESMPYSLCWSELDCDGKKLEETVWFYDLGRLEEVYSNLCTVFRNRLDPALNAEVQEKTEELELRKVETEEKGSILKGAAKTGGIVLLAESGIVFIGGGSIFGIGELTSPGFALNVLGKLVGKSIENLGKTSFGLIAGAVFLGVPIATSGIKALVSWLNSDNKNNGEPPKIKEKDK